jgi:ribosomal-protein-alanine N-acetyltransferase
VTGNRGVRIRRATRGDLDFLADLAAHEDVRPFLAAGASFEREALDAELDRQDRDPEGFGRFVIEVAEGGEWRRAGSLGFVRVNARSRIARVERLALHPDFRGRDVADAAATLLQRELLLELGFHRLELEVYGFNERALRHAERAGWIREGVKRQAYAHGDGWVDGVCFALIREDLDE